MVMTTQDKPALTAHAAPHTPPASSIGEIAAQLGETEIEVRRQIGRALRIIGEKRTQAFVAQALEIEASGGMMLPDDSRRRTLGGVFFHLLRRGVDRTERYRIFQPRDTRQKAPEASTASNRATRAPQPAAAPFDWAAVAAAARAALAAMDKEMTVKATLTIVGRPGNVTERGDVLVVVMRGDTAPTLPKGVPAPTRPTTNYLVLISRKQWRKVAEALAADPADKLLIEGYPTVQPAFAGITVYATSATTTGIQAGKRAAQQATPPD